MSAGHLPAMSNAAFAGFLRLLLTPLNETPEFSGELRAYLDYLCSVKDADGKPHRAHRQRTVAAARAE